MNSLLIAAAAEGDYCESLDWYANRSRAAAEGFEAEFIKALAAITANPERFPRCDDFHRHYHMKRYPFHIIYRQVTGEQWLVVAVAHGRRRPQYWSDR